MIETTLNKIRDNKPCENGWAKLLKSLGKTKADDEPLPLLSILESNGLEDALWCCRTLPEHNQKWHQFALWCAKKAMPWMSNRNAIEVAERYLAGKATKEELDLAWNLSGNALLKGIDKASKTNWAASKAATWVVCSDATLAAMWVSHWVSVGGIVSKEEQEQKFRELVS